MLKLGSSIHTMPRWLDTVLPHLFPVTLWPSLCLGPSDPEEPGCRLVCPLDLGGSRSSPQEGHGRNAAKFYSFQSWLVVPSRGSEYQLQGTKCRGGWGWATGLG